MAAKTKTVEPTTETRMAALQEDIQTWQKELEAITAQLMHGWNGDLVARRIEKSQYIEVAQGTLRRMEAALAQEKIDGLKLQHANQRKVIAERVALAQAAFERVEAARETLNALDLALYNADRFKNVATDDLSRIEKQLLAAGVMVEEIQSLRGRDGA